MPTEKDAGDSVNLVSLPIVTPAPPTPTPSPPAPAPAPVPEPAPVVAPKPDPTPTPAPTPKPQPQAQPVPKPTPAPKPKPRLRTAEDIRASAKLERPKSTPKPPPRTPQVKASDVASRLQSNLRNVAVSYTPSPATNVSAESANRYLDVISAVLRSRWKQPSASELGGRRPVTAVSLEIAGDGRVTLARISQASGNAGMDGSVRSLLHDLSRLPAPSAYGISANTFSVEIAFEVD